jgi:large subunit ribosomal protein L18
MKVKTRKDARTKRHQRIRKHISGTASCPRMAVMVSNAHMYVQFIDDDAGITLASASSVKESGNDVALATELGKRAGEAAKEKGVTQFVVDRAGFRFHGRVKAIVDAAIETGLRNTKEEK